MKIELKEITIAELVDGYEDNAENGVIGYGGKLDIRPPYQREFIYNSQQEQAVIDTITKGFPLNVMYWMVRENGGYEVIDGQQRTISICRFINGDFSFRGLYFRNLLFNQEDKAQEILKYKLMVYFCEGTDSDRLNWFETINIAGEKLTKQELRNAVFSGSWVNEAKKKFSKNGCVAYNLANKYMTGTPIRQDYLEKAICWIVGSSADDDIREYMAKNQSEPNANELWLYFQSVINWTETLFPKYRKEMKGLEWGLFYNEYKGQKFDATQLEVEVAALMRDEDVESKKGIYHYILSRKEKYLNIRSFSDNQKREAYELQKGVCPKCEANFDINEMEGDHITPWHAGGKTTADNCQMLCRECNRRKSGK